jgi:hypothetical protein
MATGRVLATEHAAWRAGVAFEAEHSRRMTQPHQYVCRCLSYQGEVLDAAANGKPTVALRRGGYQ